MDKSKLLATLALLASFSAFSGEHTITFGGWSNHFKQDDELKAIKHHFGDDREFNESHEGIGYKYTFNPNRYNLSLTAEAFMMTDSFGEPMRALGLGLEYKKPVNWGGIEEVKFSFPVSVVQRSFFERQRYMDCDKGLVVCYKYNLDRDTYVAPHPYISVTTKLGLGADFSILPMPTFDGIGYVTFTRLHYKF